jgi:hypothetical protein
MKNYKKTLLVLAHLAGWALFFRFTYPGDGMMWREPWHFTGNLLLLAGYFYFNMQVLIPRLLSKKKVALYSLVTLLCFVLICFALPLLFRQFDGIAHPPPGRPFPRRPFDLRHTMWLHNPTTRFLLVFILSTGLEVLKQWYREQQQLLELEKLKIQAELSFLKSQIHPHFLFNCLNSIYYMTLSKDDKAPKTVLSLSDFLRFVITESNSSLIPMEKEIHMLEEYLNLQSLRTSEKFELRFMKEGHFNAYVIMPLTFIPFVENAFKYGISAHTNCFIHIRIRIDNDILTFGCDNSIVSVVKDRSRSSGVGLENIKKRLELAYPNRYSLEIGEDSQAFHVKLQLRIA